VEALKMLLPSEPIQNEIQTIVTLASTLKNYAVALFGMTQDNVDDTLIDVCVRYILDRFKGISFNEIHEAYNSANIIRKQYGVTKGELVAPIASYWAKKTIVVESVIEYERLINRQIYETEKFKQESINLYIQCVKSDGVWTGTVYQATSIARECLANRYTDVSRKPLFDLARQMAQDLKEERKRQELNGVFDSFIPNPTKEQIWSQAMVTNSCKNSHEILIG
jgi:hypothetical protein